MSLSHRDVHISNRTKAAAHKLTQLREELRQNPAPSNTQYGWVWTDPRKRPTVPVGENG